MYLRLRKKIFSFADSYEIVDSDDNLVFIAKAHAFSWRDKTTLFDPQEREVLTITRHPSLIFSPTYEVEFADGRRFEIAKKFSLFHKKFAITAPDQPELIAEGDFGEYEYSITHEQLGEIARISKQFFSFADSYGIALINEAYLGIVLACNLVIEFEHLTEGHAHHREHSSILPLGAAGLAGLSSEHAAAGTTAASSDTGMVFDESFDDADNSDYGDDSYSAGDDDDS